MAGGVKKGNAKRKVMENRDKSRDRRWPGKQEAERALEKEEEPS